jgi:copper chaperone CopZ
MAEQRTEYFIQGMKCDGCIAAANEALAQVPGFVSAQFDLAQGVGVVVGDVDPQSVCQALTEKGYPAVVKSA